MEGYVKLHRKITNWKWFDDLKTLKLFIYILTAANYEDKEWGRVVIPKGSFITSYENLASQLKLSVQNVRTSLDKLKSTYEITIKSTNKYTQINVVNWAFYQSQETETNKQTNTQTNKPLTNHQQTTNNNVLNKELKEVKNLKESITSNTKEKIDFSKIVEYWNNKMLDTKIPKVRTPITETRKSHLGRRIEESGLETIFEVIDKVFQSDFLRGLKTNFVGTFDFCFASQNNFNKIIEGNYDNIEPKKKERNVLKEETKTELRGITL